MRTLRAFLAAALLAAGPALADDPGEIPLDLRVGEATVVSKGPVRMLICDDAGLVEATEVDGFPALRGRAAGKTLCSLTDASSMRRVYRVTVIDTGGGNR
jgi:hypothetical protein